MQLLTNIYPGLKKMVREEGSAGRDKFKDYEALVGIGYRLVVTPETPPQSVRVVHRGANGRGEFVRQRDG